MKNIFTIKHTVCALIGFSLTLLFLLMCENVFAQNEGIPRVAQLPYTRYEAESATRGGSASLHETLSHDYNTIASEASNQKYVSLPANGSYAEWTTTAAFQGVNMRFTMLDNASGTWNRGSLALVINGTKVQTVNFSSYWAYQYFPNGATEPEQHPGGKTTDPVLGNIKNHNTGLITEVLNTNVPLTGISLSPNSLSLAEGQTSNLTVSYSPTNATSKALTRSSSNTAVATVTESCNFIYVSITQTT